MAVDDAAKEEIPLSRGGSQSEGSCTADICEKVIPEGAGGGAVQGHG